MSEDFLLKF